MWRKISFGNQELAVQGTAELKLRGKYILLGCVALFDSIVRAERRLTHNAEIARVQISKFLFAYETMEGPTPEDVVTQQQSALHEIRPGNLVFEVLVLICVQAVMKKDVQLSVFLE
jgi:D-serine deaminase-like pyridoxal phosphate-dependent protein